MIKLFTHTDLDGVGCAVLAKLAFGDDVDIEYCGYDDIDDRVRNFICEVRPDEVDAVYITDISVNEETARLIDIADVCPMMSIYLFDHHKTAEHLNKYDWATVTEYDIEQTTCKTCGTELFYKYLVDVGYLKGTDKHFNFVWAVTMYDTWQWKELRDSDARMVKEFNDLLYILGRDEFIDRCIRRKRVKGDDAMILPSKDERMLLDIRQKEIDAYIDKKDKEMVGLIIDGKKVGAVFADSFVSELGNTLAERHPEYDYISIVDPGSYKISYRTIKDDMDVSEVAKLYGGGGHPKAAGCMYDKHMNVDMLFYIMLPKDGFAVAKTETHQEEKKKKSWWKRMKWGKK